MWRSLRITACAAIVGSVAFGQMNPTQCLVVGQAELFATIGQMKRYRMTLQNSDPQYALDGITLQVECMRRGDGAPYSVFSTRVQAKRIGPRGNSGTVIEVWPPPLRPGETDLGIVVTPASALFVSVPRDL